MHLSLNNKKKILEVARVWSAHLPIGLFLKKKTKPNHVEEEEVVEEEELFFANGE